MKKNLTTVMFRGTKAQEEQLIAVIEKYRGTKGALMPVLQEAQEIYGYLPIKVQKIIATRMGISLEDIHRELASRHVIDHKVKQEKMTK